MTLCGDSDPEVAKQAQRNKKVQQDLSTQRQNKGKTARLLLLGRSLRFSTVGWL